MRVVLLISVLLLNACTQLLSGQEQPVKQSPKFRDAYFTTCGGAVETWANCDRKARRTCPTGYVVLEKNDDTHGIKRDLSFECKR